MSKTIRNRLLVLTGVIAAATAAPALSATFMGENFSCESAGEDLGRIFEEHKAPESAGVIPMLQNLIWMLESAISSLDANCAGEEGYSEQRQSFVNTLNSTMRTCQQYAGDSSQCYARRYD